MDRLSLPASDKLREKAAEIVSGSDYRLDGGGKDDGWLIALLIEIVSWILIPFRWLFELTNGLPEILRWTIVVGLAAVLVLLIVHIAYTMIMAIRGQKRVSDPGLDSRRRRIDPEALERLASEAVGRADYISAVRLLFRASVVRLEIYEKKSNRPGTTNRELLRRYRNRPSLSDSLTQFVEMIDRKWYGDEVCTGADYAACEAAHREIRHAIGESAHAVGA